MFATYSNKSMIFFGLFFFSFAIWRFHDYFNPNIEVQRHHTLHIHLEVRIWYLEQLKKGDFNSAILSRQEPIINQQATDATKLEMERKKSKIHSFVLRLHVKWHLLLNRQNVQVLFLKKMFNFRWWWYWNKDHLPLNGSSLWINVAR